MNSMLRIREVWKSQYVRPRLVVQHTTFWATWSLAFRFHTYISLKTPKIFLVSLRSILPMRRPDNAILATCEMHARDGAPSAAQSGIRRPYGFGDVGFGG